MKLPDFKIRITSSILAGTNSILAGTNVEPTVGQQIKVR